MKSKSNNIPIWASVITTIGIIIVALIQFHPWATTKNNLKSISNYTIAGLVIDELTNKNIGQAEITIVGRNEHYYTEGNGNFRISIKDSLETVRLRVTKDHYLPFDKSYNIPEESVIIQLKKDNLNR